MSQRKVIVVGAGAAGLAAANALAQDDVAVTVLERRPYVGGRAYSYPHPALEEVVDSQHVLLGCCTNLIDLCEQANLSDTIRWYDKQTFLVPCQDGKAAQATKIDLSSLPAPLHYAGSFLEAGMLRASDKLAIARGLMGFSRGYPQIDAGSVKEWYRRTGQTEQAIRHFWEPIVLATLNDSAENCSIKYAGKVFYELFLKSATGGRLGIPTTPLSEFYGRCADRVRALGGTFELRTSVESIVQKPDGRWTLSADGQAFSADDVVLALPFEQTSRLLNGMTVQGDSGERSKAKLLGDLEHFIHSPFISILLWYDRQITDLDHAWLLDSTIQWFFHKSRIRRYAPERGSYVELVIAGSKRELPLSRAEILEPALAELQRFFPDSGRATLLKSGILKEVRATFSVTPGLDAFRPEQATAWPGLFLAGDWTRTEWPSTMEGAVRSGRLAAGAVRGVGHRYMSPELPASGLMRLLPQG